MIAGGWYINLDRETGRRDLMAAACARAGVPALRYSALTPETMPPDIAARFARDHRLIPGYVGNFASHLGVLQLAAAGHEGQYYAVLEDDVDFSADMAALSRALSACPVAPQVLRLENPLKSAALRVWSGEGFSFLRPLHIPNSSAGYLVTPAGARAILAVAWDIDLPYDRFLRAVGRVDVDMLVCAPPPLRLLEMESTIDPTGRRAIRKGGGYRGSAFSLTREARFAARFGVLTLARVLIRHAAMRLARVKFDRDQRYVVG